MIINNLQAGYTSGRVRPELKTIVRDASFTLEKYMFLAVLGANGAGKTTLLKTCMGLLPALGGSVELGGQNIKTLSARKIATRIAWVPQISQNPWAFTVREIVLQGRFAIRGPWNQYTQEDHLSVENALITMDLHKLADRLYPSLSGGEARRVLIARALAQNTPILALDEPAAHLDPGRQIELMETLKELSSTGKAIISSLHDLNTARRFASHVLLINPDGSILFGKTEEILNTMNIEDAFNTEFIEGTHPDYGQYVLPLKRKNKGQQ